MNALSVRNLSKAFGGVRALDDVSFDVGPGEFLALIGPNGAGKSTCFNIVNGQLAPDAGVVQLGETPLIGRGPRDVCRLGVGRTFQTASVFASLSVVQNVQAALLAHSRRVYRFWRSAETAHEARALELLALVGLHEMARRPCRELAYGDVKRVELAIALAGEPRVLLMDEPTAGMAARERHDLVALVKRLVTGRGISVLFTEHAMDVVFAFADRVIVLAQGRLIAQGTPQAIRDDPQVRTVYFGTGSTFADRRAEMAR